MSENIRQKKAKDLRFPIFDIKMLIFGLSFISYALLFSGRNS